jgi:SAM-dependent methyltransferase
MSLAISIDPWWESRYALGHSQRYPWDSVVSFVCRNAPKDRRRSDVRILEIGCGTGSNLWFAAREGFTVAGIDGSARAVREAQARFAKEGLAGKLLQGDFSVLPFDDGSFDLSIDRGSLTCCTDAATKATIAELRRVLVPGGRGFFNVFADSHTSYSSGRTGADGLTGDISAGTAAGAARYRFWSRRDIDGFFACGWILRAVERLELTNMLGGNAIHSEWRIVAERAE